MPPGSRRRAAVVGATALVLVGSEWITWLASRQALPRNRLDPRPVTADEIVLVLGYPSTRRGTVSLVQRWRCRIAARSTDVAHAQFVFTGGPTRDVRSEAAVMADHAVRVHRVPGHRVVLEERSRSTWDNIAFSLPLIEQAATIKIASNTFHALRARRYLAEQSPLLAARLQRAHDYRPGELCLVKPLLIAYEYLRPR